MHWEYQACLGTYGLAVEREAQVIDVVGVDLVRGEHPLDNPGREVLHGEGG